MRAAIASAATEAAERIVVRISGDPGSTVVLGGLAGTGRSLVLKIAAQRFVTAGFHPVLVAPPDRQIDSAAIALLDTAVGLAKLGIAEDLHLWWSQPATWLERTSELRQWLKEAATSDEFVLLVDDPSRWSIPEAGETARHLDAAADLLLREIDCSRVVISTGHPDVNVEMAPISAAAVFGNEAEWGPLAPTVAKVRTAIPEVAGKPPAEIGLVIALTALTSVEELQTWWSPRLTIEQIADRLVGTVSKSARFRALWAAWIAASVPRRPTDGRALAPDVERVTSPVQLGVLNQCLLASGGHETRLVREAHAAVWRLPEDRFMARIRHDAEERFHCAYLETVYANSRAGCPDLLVNAAEALHLAGRLGELSTAQTVSAPFADQLNAFGMAAIERLNWPLAATAFDLALELDPVDSVASHYLGYSLDNDAVEPKRVEESYEWALELESSHATWHARLICFLIVQARVGDARRRWAISRARLFADERDSPAELYARLHLPVAANLLRRAELSMAYEVLNDIPLWAQSQLVGYRDQRHRLEALESAQESGSFIPAHRAAARWWTRGPELLSERHPDGRPLAVWLAAGAESVGPDGIELAVAVVRTIGEPSRGTTTLSWEQLRELTVDVGRAEALEIGDFIEVGYYSHGGKLPSDPVIRVLPRVRLDGRSRDSVGSLSLSSAGELVSHLQDLAPLGDDLLLLVMGPGIGESVIVRWPPDCWLVVDSFHRTKRSEEFHPAVDALKLFDGYADAVVLTHPHEDHTGGFASLIERRKPTGLVGWWPADAAGARWNTANASLARRQGSNEHAVAAIDRVWRDEPSSRWELHSGADALKIEAASIRVLTPLPETVEHCRSVASPDYNEMSSAMVITWHDCELLLGADLVNRRGWDSLAIVHGELRFAHTTAMKVAHHGSKEAQHSFALGIPPATDRTYLATPYSRGRKVPDFRDGEDVELLLDVMHRLRLASHHGPRPADAATTDTRRQALLPLSAVAGPLTIDLDVASPPIDDCWVAARWGGDGTLKSVHRGPGSVSVVA